MKRILLWFSAIFFAALLLLSACKLLSWYRDGVQSADEFAAVQQLRGSGGASIGISGSADEGAEPPILEEYRAVYESNSDFIGWVTIEGTQIDYPVMQTPEEPDFYLRRNFEGQYRESGVPYMQYDCDIFTSDNLILYGHSMKNGSMFTNLKKYRDQSFYSEHRFIQFNTRYSYGTYEVIAAFTTTADDGGFLFNQFVNAESEEAFNAYVATCRALTSYEIETTAVYGDRLITMATCEYSHKNGRMVVVAKKVADTD